MHIEISTSSPEHVDPAQVASILSGYWTVTGVTVNDGERTWTLDAPLAPAEWDSIRAAREAGTDEPDPGDPADLLGRLKARRNRLEAQPGGQDHADAARQRTARITVTDPDDPMGMPAYDGAAIDAYGTLDSGYYPATREDGTRGALHVDDSSSTFIPNAR